MFDSPHRRLNPLTNEWILVSPHRAKRPWLDQVEKTPAKSLPEYDPTCYLCPGNERAGGVRNPPYIGTFVFENDFAALLPEPSTEAHAQTSPLLFSEPEGGFCRVICFSPRHDLSLPEFDLPTIENVQTWTEQSADLGERDFIRYVQVFENKGEVMGASNPHPPRNSSRRRPTSTRISGHCWLITLLRNINAKSASWPPTSTSRRWSPFGQFGRSRLSSALIAPG